MKEASWNDCIATNAARSTSPDKSRADSLRETAQERLSLIRAVTKKNCNFVFEDYYTSVLEMLQALICRNGYNVLNHLCIGYYLRDVVKREELYRLFDDVRYKRNSLTYYGSRMEYETALQAIESCKRLISAIEEMS